jgi:hypothetical protein
MDITKKKNTEKYKNEQKKHHKKKKNRKKAMFFGDVGNVAHLYIFLCYVFW